MVETLAQPLGAGRDIHKEQAYCEGRATSVITVQAVDEPPRDGRVGTIESV